MAFEALLISCATADTGTATSTPKRLVMAGIIISPPLQPTAPDRKPPTKPIITKIRSTGIGFMFYMCKVTKNKHSRVESKGISKLWRAAVRGFAMQT